MSAKSLSDQTFFTEILISKKNIPLKHIALNLIENFIYSGRSLEATELLSLIEVQENSEELINIKRVTDNLSHALWQSKS